MNIRFLLLLLFFVPVFASSETRKELVTVYSYHLKPPYIVNLETETGLYFDFVDYINKKNDRYQFHLTFLPRKRLDIYLKREQLNGIIVGVNPVWFKDKGKEAFNWTDKIFDDRDEIVSHAKSQFEYKGPESLIGKTIGGVLGYYYFGINEAVSSGKIKREDANSERALLEMIRHQRVYAGIVSQATFNYLVIKHGWQGQFHLSGKPHDRYSRQVLVPRYLDEVFTTLKPIVQGMLKDPAWQEVLQEYRIGF